MYKYNDQYPIMILILYLKILLTSTIMWTRFFYKEESDTNYGLILSNSISKYNDMYKNFNNEDLKFFRMDNNNIGLKFKPYKVNNFLEW